MMTVHVLHAGDGYTYLTKQVATDDVQRDPGQSLSDYYMQSGNPPGQWVGSGVEQLGVSGQVSEAQMKALFGEGLHPDAERIIAAAFADGSSPEQAIATARLGRRFPQFEQKDDGFADAMQRAYSDFRAEHDRAPEVGVERDLIRWNVAGAMLAQKADGQMPTDADRARYLATRGQDQRQPVAGYDLVFTPVKSVSVMWGLGDESTRRQITEAHRAAWKEALEWVEREGALTRVGKAGVAQIDTHGLVATAFDHLDSRTGDPNLHTHVAVSNKVQGVDGKWRSLDGRVLHALGVAASERYNTNIEAELRRRLGVTFHGESRRSGRQAVREISGIDKSVRDAFSSRRALIEEKYEHLLREYRQKHGREAPRAQQYRMAQQATLDTRGEKGTVVPLRERVVQWRDAAIRVLGSGRAVDEMVRSALSVSSEEVSPTPVGDLVEQAMANIAEKRSTWGRFHVEAEASRLAREHAHLHDLDVHDLAEVIVSGVMSSSVDLTPPELNPAPESMRRADGESLYTVHGSQRYSSLDVLEAEDRLVRAAKTDGGMLVAPDALERAMSQGRRLNAGQRDLVARFARGGHRVEVGIGPAGTGKTSAMQVYARAVEASGGRLLGLAPSAAAAAVLGEELATPADTLHKLLDAHRRAAETDSEIGGELRLDERTVMLIDEAGMAGTPELDAALRLAEAHGATVRLLGDPAQLSAVGAGGALRLIDQQAGAAHLAEVHRFSDAAEAAASLRLREGDADALAFYIDGGRTIGGTRDDMLDDVYAAWTADTTAGRQSVMVAASNDDVVSLATRARLDRVTAGSVEHDGVELHNGTRAGQGDIIVTRLNNRRLKAGPTDFVKNGDLWKVTHRGRDGALRAQHMQTKARVTLPSDYVAEHVELGYAATIHRVQGMTVDTSHTLVEAQTTREQLYTAVTRGRHSNRMFVVVDEALDVDLHEQPTPERAVTDALRGVVARSGAEVSASETIETEYDQAHSLARLVPAYEDAYTRLLEPGREQRHETAVQAAVSEHAGAILADDAWPVLAQRLALHEAAGADVVDLLRAAAAQQGLDDAASVARVLHYRLGAPALADLDTRALPAWITPAPDAVIPQTYDIPTLPEDVDPAAHARVVEVHRAAWTWWSEQSSTETWARDYMTSRGLDGAEYGVAPAGWTNLVEALDDAGYSREDMLAAGVATETRHGKLIDRFRDRIVFPIHDAAGDVVAVTARLNPGVEDPKAPKYLNTPETDAYRKREVLYGLDPEARERLAAGDRPVLVEGPADVAALRIAAPDVVPVAACGTGVTEQHLDALRQAGGRDLSDLVVALDGDTAGRKAAARVWSMLTPTEAAAAAGLELPDGQDPAQMLQDGAGDELAARIQVAEPLTHTVLEQAIAGHRLDEVEGRVNAVRAAATTAAQHLGADAMGDVGAYLLGRFDDEDREVVLHEVMAATIDAPEIPERVELPERQIDPQVAAWLNRQADLVAARLDRLVDDVATDPPSWALEHLTAPPEQSAQRDQWQTAVRKVVAYRDRYGVTGDDPLGTGDIRGEQASAHAEAAKALETVRSDDPARGWSGTRDDDQPRTAISTRVDDLVRKAQEKRQRDDVGRKVDDMVERARRLREQQTGPRPEDDPTHRGPTQGGPRL
ncbi:MobF family relaxase [Isoptericola rhizosphaerae]|uniref:MobF family relaxase n=1 Tax=Isoptericola rhizosphaerae TaxID=3377837 RepID=UPI00383B3D83